MTTSPPISAADRAWFAVHRHGDNLCISGRGFATKEEALATCGSNATNRCLGAISQEWFPDYARVVELEAKLAEAEEELASKKLDVDYVAGEWQIALKASERALTDAKEEIARLQELIAELEQ